MSRKIEKIVIHCSDSPFGTARMIDEWHRHRGWSGIGYHFVILNGRLDSKTTWNSLDGSVEIGRTVDNDVWLEKDEIGAGAYGFNRTTVHICLIGRDSFTAKQFQSMKRLVNELLIDFNLHPEDVVGHCELNPEKTCPNFDVKREMM